MSIFDRYVLKKLIRNTLYWVVGLGMIYMLYDQIEYIKRYKDWSWLAVGKYYFFTMPEIIYAALPLLVFISVSQVVHAFNEQQETLAMLTSGASLQRLLRPFWLYISIVSMLSYGIGGWILPWGRAACKQGVLHTPTEVIKQLHVKAGPNKVVYMGYYDKAHNKGHTFAMDIFKNSRRTSRLEATHFRWEASTGHWEVYGQWKRFTRNGDKDDIETGEGSLPVQGCMLIPDELIGTDVMPEELTWGRLYKQIQVLRKQGGSNLHSFEVQYWYIVLHPIGIVLLVFLGLVLWGWHGRYRLYGTLLGMPSYAFWLSIAKDIAMVSGTPIQDLLMPHGLGLAMVIIFHRWR